MKKLLCLLLALMLLGGCAPTQAPIEPPATVEIVEPVPVEPIEPAEITEPAEAVWVRTGAERPCADYPHGTDCEIAQTGTTDCDCLPCSAGETAHTVRTMWECHGFY